MTDHHFDDDELPEHEQAKLDALLANPALWAEPDPADEEAIVAAILAEASTEWGPPSSVDADPGLAPDGRDARPAVDPAVTGYLSPDETRPDGGWVRPGETATGASDDGWVRPGHASTGDSDDGWVRPEATNGSNVVPLSRARRWMAPVASAAAAVAVTLLAVNVVGSTEAAPAVTEVAGVELPLVGTDLAPEASATATVAETRAGTRIQLDVSGLRPAPLGQYYEAWLRQDAETGVSAGTFHLRGGDADIELWAAVSPEEYPLITVTLQDEASPDSSGRVVLRGEFAPTDD